MEKENFEQVTELLTPKFRKTSNFSFRKREKSIPKLLWRISCAAAILAIAVTAAFQNQSSIHAEEIVKQSLVNFNAESSYKVEFFIIGHIDSINYQLHPDPKGTEITGTLYVINDNGTEKDRIELGRFTEIYDGKSYKQYKDGILTKQVRSNSLKLLDLFKLDSLDNFGSKKIATEGDAIIVSHQKGDVIMNGVFSRKSNRLIEAYVTTLDGQKLLGTRSIDYGVNIPESLFK